MGIYRCADDPRLVVSKRNPGMGWTLNFAHRRAYAVFAAVFGGAIAPTVAAILYGPNRPQLLVLSVFLVPIAIAVGLSLWIFYLDP